MSISKLLNLHALIKLIISNNLKYNSIKDKNVLPKIFNGHLLSQHMTEMTVILVRKIQHFCFLMTVD